MTIEDENLEVIVNLQQHPLDSSAFRQNSKQLLDHDGALVMPGFLTDAAIRSIKLEGDKHKKKAFFTVRNHNIYLTPADPAFSSDHPRNREVVSSKGCITTDQIPAESALLTLYQSDKFKRFLCAVLGEDSLYEYADPLSSVNLHYASAGQELGWHYDNSSFAITLMIQAPAAGGHFEYVKDVRNADKGEMNFQTSAQVLDGDIQPQNLTMDEGTLVLFRGRNSMHRVTPVEGGTTRMLVVLAYNTHPGVSLSESARMTFYGRLG